MSAHGFCWRFGVCTADASDPPIQHGDMCQALVKREDDFGAAIKSLAMDYSESAPALVGRILALVDNWGTRR